MGFISLVQKKTPILCLTPVADEPRKEPSRLVRVGLGVMLDLGFANALSGGEVEM